MHKLLLIAMVMLTALACARRPVTPTRESRRAIDTLFTQQVLLQQPVMDSLCLVIGDSLYHVAIDSMLQERMAEMQQLVE